MNLIILSSSVLILLIAYFTYGKFVAGKLKINNQNILSSRTHEDGIDYIPSKTPIVLGHYFASIAGAGPFVGPTIAVTFGWILAGGIFFGAVHDLTSMVASMRHNGKSIGVIIQKHIGQKGKRLFLIFSFATLILVIVVFADIIAKTFVNNPGVASASILFIFLAIVFGLVHKIIKNKRGAFTVASVIGVVLMFFFVYVGIQIPFSLDYKVWVVLLIVYVFIASLTPVSFLLQPLDYLNAFLLYELMIFAVMGVMIANLEIKMDNQVQLSSESLGYIFPILFVTVACGAISGFHSLVASGTTSKQINKVGDAKVIGYGGMLIESFLAIILVGAVMVIIRTEYASRLTVEGPVTMFADGLGGIISSTGISAGLATSLVALAVSAFALTTLDTFTRLTRFMLQEYFEDVDSKPGKLLAGNRFLATSIVVVCAVFLLTFVEFTTLWPIFGSANQMLAAIFLLAVAVWLIKKKVNPTFVLIPMFFMFAVKNYSGGIYILAVLAGTLILLSFVLIYIIKESLKKELEEPVKKLKKYNQFSEEGNVIQFLQGRISLFIMMIIHSIRNYENLVLIGIQCQEKRRNICIQFWVWENSFTSYLC